VQDFTTGVRNTFPVFRQGVDPDPPLLTTGCIQSLNTGGDLFKVYNSVPVSDPYTKRHLMRDRGYVDKDFIRLDSREVGDLSAIVKPFVKRDPGIKTVRVYLFLTSKNRPLVKPAPIEPAGKVFCNGIS
jgi:hypothetical protein